MPHTRDLPDATSTVGVVPTKVAVAVLVASVYVLEAVILFRL